MIEDYHRLVYLDFVESESYPILTLPVSVLDLRACELGATLKNSLSCLFRSDVRESDSLILAIDQLVFAIQTGLKLMKPYL